MLTLIAFLFALTLLIAVHEFGHYRMAVACKVPVLVFSIGFGKVIYRWRPARPRPGQNTEFVIGALSLGGYIQMLDSREGDVPPDLLPLAFDQQSLKVRAAIVAAGPLANLLLAVLLFTGLAWWGQPQALPILASPVPGSWAEHWPGPSCCPASSNFFSSSARLAMVLLWSEACAPSRLFNGRMPK